MTQKTRLLIAMLLAATAMPACAISTDTYTVNFDRNTVRTRTNRILTALRLDGSSIAFPDPMRMYADLTSQHFTVHPGQRLQPAVFYSGTWMQTYIYIDFNRNGQFDVQTPGPKGQLTPKNELVCFSGMELADGSYNSAGQRLNNLSDVAPPAFTLPADIEPGLYMMRWKIDWNNCDPGGRMDETNSILQNGGVILDVLLHVTADPAADGYSLVFADEFDLPDGSRPDPSRWTSSARSNAAWNRWISDSPSVAFIQDGSLVCRAIPNPDTSPDAIPMLTGAMETRNKFSFTYGKVEVRLRTAPFTGNFPAAWMMPQPPCAVWPNAGEIDIFETIDTQHTAYHTIHSHWSYDLGHTNDPKSGFSEAVNVSEWHRYGVEWIENLLIFTVDDVIAGTYTRSTDEAVLAQGQWPFDKPFYLILNQSVGAGTWAQVPDVSHTYETRFDYVRVYQRSPIPDSIRDLADQPDSRHGSRAQQPVLHDLYGRSVPGGTTPRPGLYILDGRKILIK